MNNILCCNAGRRGRLMIDMRKTIGDSGNVVATDNWSVAPAIFFANKQYVVPKNYTSKLYSRSTWYL